LGAEEPQIQQHNNDCYQKKKKKPVKAMYEKFDDKKKWKLSGGAVVEDKMMEFAISYKFEQ
jgi:hypothetical protein